MGATANWGRLTMQRDLMTRAICGLAMGGVGAHASAQAVSLEMIADATAYSVTDPISLEVYAAWDDAQVGALPGGMTALADFNFRVETEFGISPVSVTFHPMLSGSVDVMDGSGVEISGFQLPPFFMLPLDDANPILIAAIECESFGAPLLNEIHFELTSSPSVSVYFDDFGFSTYQTTIGQKSIVTVPVEVLISGGPCCEEEPCNLADLADPYGQLNFDDVVLFLGYFSSQEGEADLAAPFGSFDFSDVAAFLTLFGRGCP